jgi:hypothetical protein
VAYQIFISHTKDDVEFCDKFDRVVARVGIKAFRSEFETIEIPQWETIKKAMDKSRAMFLLVGRQLVAHQASLNPDWKYTQNWIAYETGLACERGIDVWVCCDYVDINFPVPYFNNYTIWGLDLKRNFEYMKDVLTAYNNGQTYSMPIWDRAAHCPYENCGIVFNLHSQLSAGATIKCPQCLRDIFFEKGFLLDES